MVLLAWTDQDTVQLLSHLLALLMDFFLSQEIVSCLQSYSVKVTEFYFPAGFSKKGSKFKMCAIKSVLVSKYFPMWISSFKVLSPWLENFIAKREIFSISFPTDHYNVESLPLWNNTLTFFFQREDIKVWTSCKEKMSTLARNTHR